MITVEGPVIHASDLPEEMRTAKLLGISGLNLHYRMNRYGVQ